MPIAIIPDGENERYAILESYGRLKYFPDTGSWKIRMGGPEYQQVTGGVYYASYRTFIIMYDSIEALVFHTVANIECEK